MKKRKEDSWLSSPTQAKRRLEWATFVEISHGAGWLVGCFSKSARSGGPGGNPLVCTPAEYVVVGFFDGASDLGPEILTLDPFAFPGCGLMAHFGIAHEQVEHALKVGLVTATEGEASALDYFIVLWNVAGQDADAGGHGIEKGQRQALEFRR